MESGRTIVRRPSAQAECCVGIASAFLSMAARTDRLDDTTRCVERNLGMCGIFGVVNGQRAAPIILEGLERLEYRGYDSAGMATVCDGYVDRRRTAGHLSNLRRLIANEPLHGTIGIGHTRWATHGGPTSRNAHPHATDRVAVVHNGIIENYRELRTRLVLAGRPLTSETDTEVLPWLITEGLADGLAPREAVRYALNQIEGSYALGIVFSDRDDLLIAARHQSPLAIGLGADATFIGSDPLALAPHTRHVLFLEDGDIAEISRHGRIAIFDSTAAEVGRPVRELKEDCIHVSKLGFDSFMHKEIHEQPTVAARILSAYDRGEPFAAIPFDLAELSRLTIVACGSSFHAALIAKYWFEGIAGLPVDADIASEFRYRRAPRSPREGVLLISQSGETADTLACLRMVKAHGLPSVALVNVPESSIGREADAVLPLLAGPEVGVASTKAFTAQLIVLALLVLHAARARTGLELSRFAQLHAAVRALPILLERALTIQSEAHYAALATAFGIVPSVLYVGRGTSYALALEGALKLKEIAYIHAEAHAAGELKHGPIALVDDHLPVVAIAPRDELFVKSACNLEEIAARGGKIIALSDPVGCAELADTVAWRIMFPAADPFVLPILAAVPLQLIAYYWALARGADVDRPRNLAKSVTVE
jgi:glutamine---fructose-6-phosphate transaminase (isomerizing)